MGRPSHDISEMPFKIHALVKHLHSSIGDMPPREYKNHFGEEFFPETDNMNDDFMNLAMS